jgi:type VI secretion system secreted protein Hcp
MKVFDSCSPDLFQATVSATNLATATLTMKRKDNGNTVLTVQLIGVFVSSDQFSGSSELPTESVSFSANKVVITDTASGATVCWDNVLRKTCS